MQVLDRALAEERGHSVRKRVVPLNDAESEKLDGVAELEQQSDGTDEDGDGDGSSLEDTFREMYDEVMKEASQGKAPYATTAAQNWREARRKLTFQSIAARIRALKRSWKTNAENVESVSLAISNLRDRVQKLLAEKEDAESQASMSSAEAARNAASLAACTVEKENLTDQLAKGVAAIENLQEELRKLREDAARSSSMKQEDAKAVAEELAQAKQASELLIADLQEASVTLVAVEAALERFLRELNVFADLLDKSNFSLKEFLGQLNELAAELDGNESLSHALSEDQREALRREIRQPESRAVAV